MSVRGGTRNTALPERQHPTSSGRSKYLQHRDARLAARIAGYDAVPTNQRGGFTRPGSQNK